MKPFLMLRPFEVTSAALTASNVTETVSLYNLATSYSAGNQVREDTATGSLLYESIVGSNTGNPLTDATKWLPLGATNRWKMFDGSITSQTQNADSIEDTIQITGRIDSVALLNIDAASAQVIATDATDGVVFDETVSLVSTDGITDLFAWLTEPIERVADKLITDIPTLYSDLEVQIILTDTGATAKCGAAIVGLSKGIGDTQYGASVGIQDYSRKERDDFGNYVVVERAFSKRANFTVWMNINLTDQVQILLARYRATPMVYVGSDMFGSTLIYGFFREANVEISYPTISIMTIEIEGLT